MNAVKTARTYTVEELREKADLALNVPSLVEIVKNAPVAENGKINLTQVRDRAYQRAVEETHDLKDAKKLADSTRALAMLRQDHAEKFEKLIAQAKQPESNAKLETGKEPFREFLFRIRAHQFLDVLLPALFDTADPTWKKILLNDLIQLLEEKFGLKIKVCGNCKDYYNCDNNYYDTARSLCIFGVERSKHNEAEPVYEEGVKWPEKIAFDTCRHWAPKEVSEKPSSA